MARVLRTVCFLVLAVAIAWWLLRSEDPATQPVAEESRPSGETHAPGLRATAPVEPEKPAAPSSKQPLASAAPTEDGTRRFGGKWLQVRFSVEGTRLPPVGSVTVLVKDLDGAEVHRLQRRQQTSGVSRMIAKGQYDVVVESDAYRQASPCRVDLRTQAVARAHVTLVPREDAAWIDVHVELPARWHDVPRGFIVMAGREGAWHRYPPLALDRANGTFRVGPLAPGACELIVWAGASHVGRAVVDAAGSRTEVASVRVGPGKLVPLLRERQEEDGGIAYSDWYAQRIDVTLKTQDGTPLPVLWWRTHQNHVFWRHGENEAAPARPRIGSRVPSGAVLGPYPYDDVSATWPVNLRTLLK